MNMTQYEIAKKYVERGIPVFPCKPSNKAPLTKNGFHDATTDAKQIEAWWSRFPNALVGSPHDGFVVIDIDDYDLDELSHYLVEGIKEFMEEHIITPDMLKVRTLSGGTHIYAKAHSGLARQIKRIHQVDVLGEGGYVILPDQRNYVSLSHDDPWNLEDHLPELNIEMFTAMVNKFEPLTKYAAKSLREYRQKQAKMAEEKGEVYKRLTPESQAKLEEARQRQRERYAEVKDTVRDRPLAFVDYDANTITFEINEGVYESCRPDREKEIDRADGSENLIDPKTGKLTIQPPYNTETINRIFHNQGVQRVLGKSLKLKLPHILSDRTVMNSILPGHIDESPSMGVRWNETRTHLIIRDFSNYFSDKFNQIDYNIVRLYAVKKYGTNVPKLTSVEFVVWFTRMLWEADLVDVNDFKQQFATSIEKLSTKQREVAEGFLTLDATRRMYEGYAGETVFADKFCSAWCGVSVSTANRAKKALQEKGIVEKTGVYDCNPGRDDGFFKTSLFKVVSIEEEEEDRNMKLSEAYDPRKVKVRKTVEVKEAAKAEKATKVVEDVKSPESNDESEVRDRYPNMATVVGMEIDEHHRKVIKNFADDFDLEGVPQPGNMFVPLLISPTFEEIEMPDPRQVRTFELTNFVLETVESMDDSGNILLVARAESEALSDIADELSEGADNVLEDRDELFFVVCTDIDPSDFDSGDHDMDYLTLQFNEYVQKVSGSELFIRHMDESHAMRFIDGKDFGMDD